ncbi:MAG: AAA family ATPase [Planctomycetota bacterium]
MLVSFSVSNFRSFGEEVTLSMVASNRYSDHSTHVMSLPGGDRSIVRTAVIYGANAAGKSNLVKAMEYAQKWILGAAGRLSAVDAYAFQPNARAKPSSFEFRFVANGRIFAYGFDVTRHSIQGEWLALVGAEGDEVIFERNADGHTKVDEAILKKRFPNDTKIINLLTSLSKNDLNDSQLFIESVREVRPASQGETMAEVVRWLTRTLVVIPMEQAHEHVLRRLARDPEYLGFAEALLGNVGTGIHRLQIEERERRIHEGMDATFDDIARHVSENPDTDAVMSRHPRAPDRYVARYLMASHSSDGMEYRLPMSEESDGTRRLLALAPLLKAGAKEPRVFVVDELDRSLHPLLCWEFLRLFADTMPGAQRQLVVTTHEAHLLNQELLRRDEYWFMEKDETQQSRLYPLSEYRDVRKDLQLERGYLSGRFGAVPIIGLTDDLEALLADPAKEPMADAPQATPT